VAISIYPPSRSGLGSIRTTFALQQDHWNDYSFQTLYHLYHQGASESSASLIGGVKILRKGQSEADGILIQEPFDELAQEYCSVGVSLDYYQRLNEISEPDRTYIVTALRDVIAIPQLQLEFRGERGWGISLFRDDPDPDAFIADATAIYNGNYGELADLDAALSFHPGGWSTSLRLDFSAKEPPLYWGPWRHVGPSRNPVLLPRRIIVLIGRNGSGKSTLLARIARVAFASPSERSFSDVQKIGRLEPSSIGFTKIIAISYSAFDNFIVPGIFESDVRQIAADIEKGSGRYVYAGLRDIAAEARDDLQVAEQTVDDTGGQTMFAQDRRTTTRLKSLNQLADEFARLVAQIHDDGARDLFDAVLELLLADPSFVDVSSGKTEDFLGVNPRETFLGWSTGHKIALHVLTSLVAHATRRSIVLFDEPESHLHPPLIAAVMNAVRVVLEERNSFAIVATHSPVVLQETLAEHVRIVSRAGDHFEIANPVTETFGENVGILTQNTFGLTAAATDFYHVLDNLIASAGTIEEIDRLFSPALSSQARAYVLAGIARKGRKE
jgi:predicted ATPase